MMWAPFAFERVRGHCSLLILRVPSSNGQRYFIPRSPRIIQCFYFVHVPRAHADHEQTKHRHLRPHLVSPASSCAPHPRSPLLPLMSAPCLRRPHHSKYHCVVIAGGGFGLARRMTSGTLRPSADTLSPTYFLPPASRHEPRATSLRLSARGSLTFSPSHRVIAQ